MPSKQAQEYQIFTFLKPVFSRSNGLRNVGSKTI